MFNLPFLKRKPNATLEEIGNRFGTDKTKRHGYHRFYPHFLEQYRNKQITMLEIGLYRGASLRMWLEYFPHAFVYGLDINGAEEEGERYHILKGDQGDDRSLSRFDGTNLDLVVDDGSHLPKHQISAFAYLFPKALKSGGLYIIEDVETSYWKRGSLYGYQFKYGYGEPTSAVEVFKHAVDFVNDEFLHEADRARRNESCPIEVMTMQAIATVTFAHNCIVIRKKSEEYSKYDNREYRRRQ